MRSAGAVTSESRLGRFLNPNSVALVGLPGDPTAPLARPLRALRSHGFPGRIFAVNPRHRGIGDVPCYASLADLPERPDTAWIGVPGDRVLPILKECVALGIRNAVVVTAGFAESGVAGTVRQTELIACAREGGLTLLGPNSIGFVNLWDRVPLCFSAAVDVPSLLPGQVAIVSQSGGLGGAVLNRLQDRHLGASYLISIGNEAGVGLNECVEFLLDDPRTTIIILVVESFRDGGGFRRAAARAHEVGKPIVALRLGITELGAQLARSHTGALVGSRRAWQAVAEQLGIILAEDVAHITDAVIWCARARATPLRNVVVVTSSGGAAVHLADALTTAGFGLPPLSSDTIERLHAALPAYATPANPLDITAGLPDETFAAALEAIGGAKDVDALVLPMTMVPPEQAAGRLRVIDGVASTLESAVGVCWLGGSATQAAAELADRTGIASFGSSSMMLRAMAAVRDQRDVRARWLRRPAPEPVAPIEVPEAGILSHELSCRLLEGCGIELPRQVLVRDAAGARAAAVAIGYPVAAKVVGRGFLHKSDQDAVRLGLGSDAAVAEALAALEILSATGEREGFLLQEMVRGTEVLIGVKRDPTFGALLAVGLGGTATELVGAHRFVPLPATAEEIEAQLGSVAPLRVLKGYRRQPPGDVQSLVRVALRIGQLALALGSRLREIDLNPVVVGPQRAVPVDVLIVMED